jgi:hypothetical protein
MLRIRGLRRSAVDDLPSVLLTRSVRTVLTRSVRTVLTRSVRSTFSLAARLTSPARLLPKQVRNHTPAVQLRGPRGAVQHFRFRGTPRTLYTVAPMSFGENGDVLGYAPWASEEPITCPARTPPPKKRPLKHAAQWSRPINGLRFCFRHQRCAVIHSPGLRAFRPTPWVNRPPRLRSNHPTSYEITTPRFRTNRINRVFPSCEADP